MDGNPGMIARLCAIALIAACLGLVAGCAPRPVQTPQRRAVPGPANAPARPQAGRAKGAASVDQGAKPQTAGKPPEAKPSRLRVLVDPKADLAAADLGIAVYPGAHVLPKGGSVEVRGQHTAILSTRDPYAQVAQFYRDQYAAGALAVQESGERLVIERAAEKAILTIIVQASPDNGGTRITLSRLRIQQPRCK